MRGFLLGGVVLVCVAMGAEAGPDEKLKVTAELTEIPSAFPADDLYAYAYVMKYRVKGGPMDGQTLLVAHYKPRRQRRQITDRMKAQVAGKLKRFRKGDLHLLVLDPELERIWKGTLIDDYWATDRKRIRYWCLRVDPA